jgi:hypothetical protein
MNNFEQSVLCKGCEKLKVSVKEAGSMFGVNFIVLHPKKRYQIVDNPNISWNEIMPDRQCFDRVFVPKFGKYEIEQYVGHRLREALFITGDITDLMHSELVCYDMYNDMHISNETIVEYLMKCFDIVEESDKKIVLMFKWKPYYNL